MKMILLESDRWRLWIEPQFGVQWKALEARRGDDWLAVVPDCREIEAGGRSPRPGQDESAPLAAASFHMLPYSNRVRDGRFAFDGSTWQLGRAAQHAIHGALRKLPWSIEHQAATRVSCRVDTRELDGVDWPWPIESTIEHALSDRRLTSEISLTNRGTSSMPAGFGWHPYFVREIDGAAPMLRLPVSGVFPDANGDCLPDGAPVELPAELDFRALRELDPARRIDCCLSGLAGPVRIEWPAAEIGFTMLASPVCRYLVLFNPDKPHFAVEPVTNANDAFNLEAAGIDAGMQVLAPGETLRATMTLELD